MASIDPSAKRVTIGYRDKTRVSILDAKSLAPLANPQTGDLTNGALPMVAWSREGTTVIAGGHAKTQLNGEWRRLLRRFDSSGRGRGADITSSDRVISGGQAHVPAFRYRRARRRSLAKAMALLGRLAAGSSRAEGAGRVKLRGGQACSDLGDEPQGARDADARVRLRALLPFDCTTRMIICSLPARGGEA
jgi:hypothetical protein